MQPFSQMPKIIPNTATLCKWQSQVCHLHETMSHFVTQPKIPHPTVGCDDPIAPQFTPAGRAVAPRPPPQSAPYGNATSTVKNRNVELPPSGTSLHPSDNSAFPFTLILVTNDLPASSAEWLNSNFGLPHSFRHSINPSPFFCYPYFIGSLSISDKRSKEIHYLSYSHIERLRQIQA